MHSIQVRPIDVLTHMSYRNTNIMHAGLRAGSMLGRRELQHVAKNPNLPEQTWFEIANKTRNLTVWRNLVNRNLTVKQRNHVIKNENRTPVLDVFVKNNTLNREEACELIGKNKPKITVTLANNALHNLIGREKTRQLLYKTGEADACWVLANINLEELNETVKNNPKLSIKNLTNLLESSTEQNITETFKLVNSLLEDLEDKKVQKKVSMLLSSNPSYMKHLHLLNDKKAIETLQNPNMNTETKHEKEKLLRTIACMLSRSVLQKESITYIANLLNLLPGAQRTLPLQILNLNYTCTSATYRQLANRKTDAKRSKNWDANLETEGTQLYNTKTQATLESILYRSMSTNWGNSALASINATLLLCVRLDEPRRTKALQLKDGQRYTHAQLRRELEGYSSKFGWGSFETESRATERNYNPSYKNDLKRTLNEARLTLQENEDAWSYWLGIGWNSTEEARNNLDLAAKLARSEQKQPK